jgi:hypothetical protein
MPVLVDVVAVNGIQGADALQMGQRQPRVAGHGEDCRKASPYSRTLAQPVVRASIAEPGFHFRLDQPVSGNPRES